MQDLLQIEKDYKEGADYHIRRHHKNDEENVLFRYVFNKSTKSKVNSKLRHKKRDTNNQEAFTILREVQTVVVFHEEHLHLHSFYHS